MPRSPMPGTPTFCRSSLLEPPYSASSTDIFAQAAGVTRLVASHLDFDSSTGARSAGQSQRASRSTPDSMRSNSWRAPNRNTMCSQSCSQIEMDLHSPALAQPLAPQNVPAMPPVPSTSSSFPRPFAADGHHRIPPPQPLGPPECDDIRHSHCSRTMPRLQLTSLPPLERRADIRLASPCQSFGSATPTTSGSAMFVSQRLSERSRSPAAHAVGTRNSDKENILRDSMASDQASTYRSVPHTACARSMEKEQLPQESLALDQESSVSTMQSVSASAPDDPRALDTGKMQSESAHLDAISTDRSVDLSDCIHGLAHSIQALQIGFSPMSTARVPVSPRVTLPPPSLKGNHCHPQASRVTPSFSELSTSWRDASEKRQCENAKSSQVEVHEHAVTTEPLVPETSAMACNNTQDGVDNSRALYLDWTLEFVRRAAQNSAPGEDSTARTEDIANSLKLGKTQADITSKKEESVASCRSPKPAMSSDARLAIGSWYAESRMHDLSEPEGLCKQPPSGCDVEPPSSATSTTRASHSLPAKNMDTSSPDTDVEYISLGEAERQLFLSGDDLSDLSSESTVSPLVNLESVLKSHRSDASADTLLLISGASSDRSASIVSDLAKCMVNDCLQKQVLLEDETPMHTVPLTTDPLIISDALLASSSAISTSHPASREHPAGISSESAEKESACNQPTQESSTSSPGWAAAMAETILHSTNSKPIAELSAAWARHMVDQVGQMLNGDDIPLGDCPQLALDFGIPDSARPAASTRFKQADESTPATGEAHESRPATPAPPVLTGTPRLLMSVVQPQEKVAEEGVKSQSETAVVEAAQVLQEPEEGEQSVAGCLVTAPVSSRSICSEKVEYLEGKPKSSRSATYASEHLVTEINTEHLEAVMPPSRSRSISECLEANPKSSRSVTYASEHLETEIETKCLEAERRMLEAERSVLEAERSVLEAERSVLEAETPPSPSQSTTVSLSTQPEDSRSVKDLIVDQPMDIIPECLEANPKSARSVTHSSEHVATQTTLTEYLEAIAPPSPSQSTMAICSREYPAIEPSSCRSIPQHLTTQPPTSRSTRSTPECLSQQSPIFRGCYLPSSMHTTPETSARLATMEEFTADEAVDEGFTVRVQICHNDDLEEYVSPEVESSEKEYPPEECRNILVKELAKLNDMASGLEGVALGLDATAEKLHALELSRKAEVNSEAVEATVGNTPMLSCSKVDETVQALPSAVKSSEASRSSEVAIKSSSSDNVLQAAGPKVEGTMSSSSPLVISPKAVSKAAVEAPAAQAKRVLPQRRCEAIDLTEEAGEAAQWGSLRFSQESQRTRKPVCSFTAPKDSQPLTLNSVLASADKMRPPSRSGKDSSMDPAAELRRIAQLSGNASLADVLEMALPHVTNQLRDVLQDAVKQSIAKELEQYTNQLEIRHSPSSAREPMKDECLNSDALPREVTLRWGRIVTACMAREQEKLRQSEERETLQRALREATDQNKFTQRDGRLQNVLFASQASWHRQQRFELLQEIEFVQMAWEDERGHMAREMEKSLQEHGTVEMQCLQWSEANGDAVTVRPGDLPSFACQPVDGSPKAEEVHDKWAAMAWPNADSPVTAPLDSGADAKANAACRESDVPLGAQQDVSRDATVDSDDGVVSEALEGSLLDIREDESPEASQIKACHALEDGEEITALPCVAEVSVPELIHEATASCLVTAEAAPEFIAEASTDQPRSSRSSPPKSGKNSPAKPPKSGRNSPAKKDLQCMPKSPHTKVGLTASPVHKDTSQMEDGQAHSLPFYTPPPKVTVGKQIVLKSMCERSHDLLVEKREEIDRIKQQRACLEKGQNDLHRALTTKLQTLQAELWRLENEHMKLNEDSVWQSQVNSESKCSGTPDLFTNPSPVATECRTPISGRFPVKELQIAEQSPESVHTDCEDEESENEHEQTSSAATTSREHEQASSAASTSREHEEEISTTGSSRDVNTLEQKALELVEQRESEIGRLRDQILRNGSLDAHKLDQKNVVYTVPDKPSWLCDKSQQGLPLGDLRRKLDTQHALRVRDLPKRAVGGTYPVLERKDFQVAQPAPLKPPRCSPKEPSEFPFIKRCSSQPKTSGNAVRMLPSYPTFGLQGGDQRAMANFELDPRQSGRNESGRNESSRNKKKEKRVSARDVKQQSKLDVLGSMYAPLLAPTEVARHHIQKVQSLPSLRPPGYVC